MAKRSIDTASLTAVADAIRQKSGSTSPLTFPSAFVSAVQALVTDGIDTTLGNAAAAGDLLTGKSAFANGKKIDGSMPAFAAADTVLDSAQTSAAIEAGYHAAGSVSIVPQEVTVIPSDTTQEITPDSGKVITKIYVPAVSTGGVEMQIGAIDISETTAFTVGGLSFTPNNAVVLLLRRSVTKNCLLSAFADAGYTAATARGIYANAGTGSITNVTANGFTFNEGEMVYTAPHSCKLNGVYGYIVWRE